jgi:phytoene dehydrogenase-like protein
VDELGITHREWTFVKPAIIESRGLKANNHEEIKQRYPQLLAHPIFGNMTSGELFDYALRPEYIAKVDQYATVFTYFSNIITAEGAEYLSELYGYKGDFTDFISPRSYLEEFSKISFELADEYVRPIGGMSTIITTLEKKVEALGGKIYTSTEIKSLSEGRDGFVLTTPKLKVKSKKLIVATIPTQFRSITGSIAKRIKDTGQFNSIQPMSAFKGAAVYSSAWWEDMEVEGTPLQAGQKFISSSNCLGTSMPHR